MAYREKLSGLKFEGLSVLRLMRVFATGVNLEFFHDLATQSVVRNHSVDSTFNEEFGAAFAKLGDTLAFLTSDIARIRSVNLLFFLVARKFNFISIHHDDKISAVHVGGEEGFIFAAEQPSSGDSDISENLVLGVDHIPFAVDFFSFGRKRFHSPKLIARFFLGTGPEIKSSVRPNAGRGAGT